MILSWFRSLSDTLKQVTVFSSTIVAGMILFFITISQINCQGRKAMEPYANSQRLINEYMDSLKRPERLQAKYFAVFKAQQKILSLRKDHYLDLGIVFFRNYYGVLILLMFFSCIGGVVLFVIANQGWLKASASLKAFFLGLAMLVTFSGLFPVVFKQEDNFNENLKNYMSYTKAELNIVDQLSKLDNPYFAATKDSINGKPVWVVDSVAYCNRVDSMITINDVAINNLTNYVLNINAKEVKSMSDVYRSLINMVQSGHDSLKLTPVK